MTPDGRRYQNSGHYVFDLADKAAVMSLWLSSPPGLAFASDGFPEVGASVLQRAQPPGAAWASSARRQLAGLILGRLAGRVPKVVVFGIRFVFWFG